MYIYISVDREKRKETEGKRGRERGGERERDRVWKRKIKREGEMHAY